MTRRTYSLIAGLVAAAGVGAWWYRARAAARRFGPRGTVIFDNTPHAGMAEGEF